MYPALALLIFGGVAFLAFDAFHDDEDDGDDPPPEDEPVLQEDDPADGPSEGDGPNEIAYGSQDGGEDILGTAGDDVLVLAPGDDGPFPDLVELGDGDDIADLRALELRAVELSVDGGAGDDTLQVDTEIATLTGGDGDDLIESDGVQVVLDGGDGEDTIRARNWLFSADGGDGDDVIEIVTDEVYDGSGLVRGGEGDDTLRFDLHVFEPDMNEGEFPSVWASGGDGADVFEIDATLNPDVNPEDREPGDEPYKKDLGLIVDFEPGTDAVRITLDDADGANPTGPLGEVRVERTVGIDVTEVIIPIGATSDTPATDLVLRLETPGIVTAEMLDIVDLRGSWTV